MYCERCNIDFPESLRYCKWCGQHLTHRAQATTHIRRCQGCGHVVKSAWSYCRSCGAKMGATVPQPEVICSGCGEVVEPPGLICRVCGLEVPQEEDPDADLVAALDAGPGTYSYCASCGVRLDAQTNRCPNCGLPVTKRQLVSDALQTCPICQTQNLRGTGTCSGCGGSLPSGATSSGDIAARAAGGPPTLPDAPMEAPGDLSAVMPEPQRTELAPPDLKPAGLAGLETTPVSYTEILGSWAPPEEGASPQHAALSGPPSNGGVPIGEPGDTSQGDQTIDEFKTNVMMPALDVTQTDLPPTGSLPTGSLPGSRSTSVFDPNDLPFEALHPPEPALPQAAPPQERSRPSGEVTSGDWVLAARDIPEPRSQPVEPFVLAETPASDMPRPSTDPVVPAAPTDRLLPEVTIPQAVRSSLPETGELPGAAVQAPSPHAKPVPPEVAHYMAFMDRQSASEGQNVAPPQPSPARKSRLLPIALVTGLLALGILGGLGYFVWRFRQRQTANLTRPIPPVVSPTTDTTQAQVPQPSPTASIKPEIVAPEGMVMVPAGVYIVGRDDGDDKYHLAAPKHTVTLASFYVDKTEVTNGEYKRFVDATGHVAPGAWQGADFPEGKANYPVIDVRWQDAVDYGVWAGKRLPSEAEWEAAARGTDGRIYPWGDRWQSGVANVGTTGINQVGVFPGGASPSGALDMIGNVWEWTADELKLYPGSPGKMPESVGPGITYRVIRGGAYDSKQDSTYRGFVDASKSYPKTGFRCVKSAE